MLKFLKQCAHARVSSREQAENSAVLDQQIARLKSADAELILADVESGREGKGVGIKSLDKRTASA